MPAASTPKRPTWETEGAEKAASVQRMFGEIAPTYDLLNGVMSLGMHHRWRGAAVRLLRLQSGDSALDLCCGTGDFLLPLRAAIGPLGRLVGADFCLPMLEISAKKDDQAELCVADATRLPFADASFQGVSVGWGIRNVSDVDAAHREIARVLKPGGRFVSLDLATPRAPFVGRFNAWLLRTGLPILGSFFGKKDAYTYLPKSVDRHRTREELADSMRKAGFEDVSWKDMALGNICVHSGVKP